MDAPHSGGIVVAAGADLHARSRKVFGLMPFSVKVSARDTAGGLFVLEQSNAYRGGPARHVHRAQEEWFYVVRGRYHVEVDDHLHVLGPGDALLAPRGVPHAWALVDDVPGTMVIAFSPAGSMEAFFDEACELHGAGPTPELTDLFRRHGMDLVGPPLEVDER